MTEAEAFRAIGKLAGITTGWNDDSINGYVDELIKLDDPDVLMRACTMIGRTWHEPRRPPVANIIAAYRNELLKEEKPRPLSDRVISPAQGVEIARKAYVAECRKQFKEPNMKFFEQVMGRIGNKP